ncbi:MAG: type I restriction-modification enzyme R subunit C-terminal domain-containing protein, partial [Bacillota bacterium]
QIFYSYEHRRRELTYKMIQDLYEKLTSDCPGFKALRLWQAYEGLDKVSHDNPKNELIALVELVRRAIGIDQALTPYEKTVDKNFQNWAFQKQAGKLKFNEQQMEWLRMIKDHIAMSFHLEREDLDLTPFDAKGGLGGMWQLFGDKTDGIIDELNDRLVA